MVSRSVANPRNYVLKRGRCVGSLRRIDRPRDPLITNEWPPRTSGLITRWARVCVSLILTQSACPGLTRVSPQVSEGNLRLLEKVGWSYRGTRGDLTDRLVPTVRLTGKGCDRWLRGRNRHSSPRAVQLPKWQGWAKAAKKKLEEMTAGAHWPLPAGDESFHPLGGFT